MSDAMVSKKETFLDCVKDSVGNLFYYDRKDCEDMNRDDVEALISSGSISLRDIVETFQAEIIKSYPNKFKDELEMAYLFRKDNMNWDWAWHMPPPNLRALNEFATPPKPDVPFQPQIGDNPSDFTHPKVTC